jgi:hypothetical protein
MLQSSRIPRLAALALLGFQVACGGTENTTFRISGKVTGATGVNLTLSGAKEASIQTDSAGSYSFQDLKDGIYTVTPSLAGFTFQPTSLTITVSGADLPNNDFAATPAAAYQVKGSVSGLTGTLVLELNGENDLPITQNGSFAFAATLADGASYHVTVTTQPDGQTCTVHNGDGTVNGHDITFVVVTCEDNFHTIGGSVSGFAHCTGGLTVYSRTDPFCMADCERVAISSDGPFTFANGHASGITYSALAAAGGKDACSCLVTNSSGTVGTVNVTNIAVTCGTPAASYRINGTVSGYTSDDYIVLSVTADPSSQWSYVSNRTDVSLSRPSFSYLPDGFNYNVTVVRQPSGQTCSVANGVGTISGANVTNIEVSCVDT